MQSGKHLYDKKTNMADSTNRRNTLVLPNRPDRKSRTSAHKKNCSKTKAISPRKSEDNPNGFIPRGSEADVTSVDQQLRIKPYDLPLASGYSDNSEGMNWLYLFPIATNTFHSVPESNHVHEEMSPDSSENVNEHNASQDSNALPVFSSGRELCVDGSSYSSTGRFDFNRLRSEYSAPQNRTYLQGQVVSGISVQDQQYLQQDREINRTEPSRLQCSHQQRNENENTYTVLGPVRSPDLAKQTFRLGTFSRWPSAIEQTPARLAEAGFYYTGFQDTVRCFACDGGLKNWDPGDDPWIEHARWFPQCLHVRHIKGEEFINLVRMVSQESDEEDYHTADEGAASGEDEKASSEIIEPSVLESVAAQTVMQMGFSKKDVVMAINDIFKKGKQEFTCQEITDILLEKETPAETMNSMLAVDSSPSVGSMSATEYGMNKNRRLKELLCIECKSRQRNILFLPCTHCVVCDLCSRDLHICTHCYRKIKDRVRMYVL